MFNTDNAQRLKIFTWHIHGSYLFYLSQGDYDLYIPVNADRTEGYYGRGETFPFGGNVTEVPAAEVRNLDIDCILFQSEKNFLVDQYEVLSEAQRQLPSLYLEHNTPVEHPTNTLHIMNDPEVMLVHVTHYNRLMWNNQVPLVQVIEHGVHEPAARYTGELEKGIVVINHIKERGRIAGWDIYEALRKKVPLDLVGMGTEQYGGLGEVLHPRLPAFTARYRFLFNPMRYTSFGLAVCEAMMMGMPVVAMATTEYATVLKNGQTGFVHTNLEELAAGMHALLDNVALARDMGQQARTLALHQFNIDRFVRDWNRLFHLAINRKKLIYENNSIYQ
jgi:hypothetical protein